MPELLLSLLFFYVLVSFGFFQLIFSRHLRKSFLNRTQDLKAADYRFLKPAQAWFLEQNPQTLWLKGQDGHQRFAYFLQSEKGNSPTVILLHGYTARALSMAAFAEIYHTQHQFNVLMVDAIGHGQSEGATIGFGYNERHEINRWLDKLTSLGASGPVLLHGLSMGASTSLFSLISPLNPRVKGIIADSPFIQLKPIFIRQAKQIFHLPAGILLPAISTWMKLLLGYGLNDIDFMRHADAIDRPLLLIHGMDDYFVPYTQSEALKKAHPDKMSLWLVPKSQHACALKDEPDLYLAKIKAFIQSLTL